MATMELTFTGLCGLLIVNSSDPKKPNDVQAVLVDTRAAIPRHHDTMPQHFPLLTFRARDYVSGPLKKAKSVPITVAADGEELIHLPLNDANVEIKVNGITSIGYQMDLVPVSQQVPQNSNEEAAMNWVPELSLLGLQPNAAVTAQPAARPPGVTCHVGSLPAGRFEARRLVRDLDNPENALGWQFGGRVRAIADHVVLTSDRPSSRSVAITISRDGKPSEKHELNHPAEDDVLPLCITNLPSVADIRVSNPQVAAESQSIRHLMWYSLLEDPAGGALERTVLPKVAAVVRTRQGAICPSTRFFI